MTSQAAQGAGPREAKAFLGPDPEQGDVAWGESGEEEGSQRPGGSWVVDKEGRGAPCLR